MAVRKRTRSRAKKSYLDWPVSTELVGLVFELIPEQNATLFPQYAVGLHAWFLDQVRSIDPELSAYLHDGESEKPFTISRLEGQLLTQGKKLQLVAGQTYYWYVTALSARVTRWLAYWVKHLPEKIDLRSALLPIISVKIAPPPTTYAQLLSVNIEKSLKLSFVSPTSFRRKNHHLPLPWPVNVFHSYLRRWNDFSGKTFDQEAFLAWVDESVLINRHQLESMKVAAGKRGSVTGFIGSVEFGLTRNAQQQQWRQLFSSLGQLAPYCGTGHKTTFGLGQTRLGWQSATTSSETPSLEEQLAGRIAQLTEILMSEQKRTGGERAISVCQTRATILARREFGESLQEIATDLEMPYETVKTYVKLARRVLKSKGES
ncbi:MAG: CRISPR-associated endoribonuclease Cas6 [Coleofasciculaceae cyanobacterium]